MIDTFGKYSCNLKNVDRLKAYDHEKYLMDVTLNCDGSERTGYVAFVNDMKVNAFKEYPTCEGLSKATPAAHSSYSPECEATPNQVVKSKGVHIYLGKSPDAYKFEHYTNPRNVLMISQKSELIGTPKTFLLCNQNQIELYHYCDENKEYCKYIKLSISSSEQARHWYAYPVVALLVPLSVVEVIPQVIGTTFHILKCSMVECRLPGI